MHLDRLRTRAARFRSGRSRPSACRCDGSFRAGSEGADFPPLVSRTRPRAVRARRCDSCASNSVYSPDDRPADVHTRRPGAAGAANLGIYTQPISFIGLPVVAVPVPLKPLPIGCRSSHLPGAKIFPYVSPARWSRSALSPRPDRHSRELLNGDQSPGTCALHSELGRELAGAHVMSMTCVAETVSTSFPRRTLAEELRLQLADEILRGGFAPGTALDETALARRFSVSRTPVREAIRMLTASGLVEVRAHRAAVVARPVRKIWLICLR